MTDQKYPAGTDISLENTSNYYFGDRGWALYFNQRGRDFIPESETGNVKIVHVNGDLAQITPTAGFHLDPGQSIRIGYEKRDWLIKENESSIPLPSAEWA